MTFQQFQATRTYCDDLGSALQDARWEDEPTGKGNLYVGCLYIEERQPHWPGDRDGKWFLLINRDEWISDDLEALERRLFQFAQDEGYVS
jgi:hypothetical protein